MKTNLKTIAYASVIGAMYVALTLLFAPVSYGAVQFRISEALAILPFFTPAAIYGLFTGCIIANIFGGNGIYDIVFGSLASLLSAYATYRTKNKYIAPLPPVIINALVIGVMLSFLFELNPVLSILSVGLGQLLVLYGLGLPLIIFLEPKKAMIFKGILSKYHL